MLHPQARRLIELIASRGVPPMQDLSPAEARLAYRDRRFLTQPEAPSLAEIRPLEAAGPHGSIPLRFYRPHAVEPGAATPLLVYLHGGGWTIGDLDTHDTLCRDLALASGAALLAVDYRMGPEHHFPAAVDDCLAAVYWARAQAEALGVDPARIAVGGDSAGGNLAAVVALLARDAGDLPLAFQLLIYPSTDMRGGHASHAANGKGYLLERATIDYYQENYVAERSTYLDWRASPLLRDDLSRLPPALVITAGFDPLRDEGLEYADRLVAAGNRASYVCFERQVHGFITMGKVLDEAATAIALCGAELRRALRPF